MEWEKAKSILIAVFLLLNVCIFATQLYVSESRKMTAGDDIAIRAILSDNRITVDAELPTEISPMRIMNLSPAEWDYYNIRRIFFQNASNVTRTNEQGNVIYKTQDGLGNSRVTIFGADGDSETLVYFESVASGDADYYLNLLGEPYKSFQLVRELEDETGGSSYLYNETQNGYAVFLSFVEITLSSDKSATIKIKKKNFVSYADGAHDVFRADEALLSFLHYKGEAYGRSEDIVIERIQLGYAEDFKLYENTRRAKPCYRIFIKGQPDAVYIDAVMNTVM